MKKHSIIMKKKSMVIPFEWIFAMIVGGAILVLAIYGVTKVMSGGESYSNKKTAEILKSYLESFETGLTTGEAAEINFRKESKIFFEDCSYLDNAPFGMQTYTFSEKTFNNRFSKKGEPSYIKNKYIFSDEEITGKDFYIFSKPFFMGFRVSDLIIINSKNYCFYQAPNDIKDEISLDIDKINFTDDIDECKGEVVCFGVDNSKCDIVVYGECSMNCESEFSYGKVVKKLASGKKVEMDYINNLWIGAIFSSPDIYECNVKRLMNRFYELGTIYSQKINIIKMKGCDSIIENNLVNSMGLAKSLKDSGDLKSIFDKVNEMRIQNEAVIEPCQLFYSTNIQW
jgi:hypothetical protein